MQSLEATVLLVIIGAGLPGALVTRVSGAQICSYRARQALVGLRQQHRVHGRSDAAARKSGPRSPTGPTSIGMRRRTVATRLAAKMPRCSATGCRAMLTRASVRTNPHGVARARRGWRIRLVLHRSARAVDRLHRVQRADWQLSVHRDQQSQACRRTNRPVNHALQSPSDRAQADGAAAIVYRRRRRSVAVRANLEGAAFAQAGAGRCSSGLALVVRRQILAL